MSFGYSVGDFVILTQLAWRTLQNARRACGEHDELAREASSLHVVLQRLQTEVSKPHSILNSGDDDRMDELATLAGNCERVTNVLLKILEKYNALSEDKKRVTKLWKRIQFGNGEMQDLSAIRLQLSAHTNAITLFLNLLSIGSQGNVEQYMTTQGGELRKIRDDVNWITASLQARSNREGSILTSYTNDDKSFWKELRRELVKEGYSSKVLRKHKTTIRNYVHELGAIGALDELPDDEPQPSRRVTPELEYAPEGKIDPSNLDSMEDVAKAVIVEAKVEEAETIPDRAKEWEFVASVHNSRRRDARSSSTTHETGSEEVDKNDEDPGEGILGETTPEKDKNVECNGPKHVRSVNLLHLSPLPLSPQAPPIKVTIREPQASTTLRSMDEQERSRWRSTKMPKCTRWDVVNKRIVLFGNYSFFNIDSLGKWIYDWAVRVHGIGTPTAKRAFLFQMRLVDLRKSCSRCMQIAPHIRSENHKEIIEDYLKLGRPLWVSLKKLLQDCETFSINALKESAAHANYGPMFISSMFGVGLELENTLKLTADIQLWGLKLDLDRCEDKFVQV